MWGMNIDVEDLKQWLRETGHDREWLAKQCNVAKPTVDGWFTRKAIPSIAVPIINRLLSEGSVATLRFTFSDWKQITQAMEKAGYQEYEEFAVDAIKQKLHEISRNSTTEEADLTSAPEPIPGIVRHNDKGEEGKGYKRKSAAKKKAQ